MAEAIEIITKDKYSLEKLLELPLEEQAIICFGVARALFKQNNGILATKFMSKALSINPELLRFTVDDDEEDWV